MRNFRCWAVSRFAVGAAPRGRPAVGGSDIRHVSAKPQHVGQGLAPAVGVIGGGAPYTKKGWWAGIDKSPLRSPSTNENERSTSFYGKQLHRKLSAAHLGS